MFKESADGQNQRSMDVYGGGALLVIAANRGDSSGDERRLWREHGRVGEFKLWRHKRTSLRHQLQRSFRELPDHE